MAADDDEDRAISELRARAEIVLRAAPRSTFFHIVSLLERLTPDAKPVGLDGPPKDERIRFRHDPSLGFRSGDISGADVVALPRSKTAALEETPAAFALRTTFLGLTGAVSPLPLYLAEEVLHEEEGSARQDFLDIFHHRIVSLLYRAVVKHSPARTHVTTRRDPWMTRALCLTGMDPEVQGRDVDLPPATLVRLAPLLTGRGRGPRRLALALAEVLEDDLTPDGTVEIQQLVGGWVEVEPAHRMRLGHASARLGVDAILGPRAYDRSGRFAVRIGPLHQHNVGKFLRDGPALVKVRDVVRLCVREPLDFDVELSLAPDAMRGFVLSTEDGPRLGRDTRLRGATEAPERMVLRDVSAAPALIP